MDAATPESSATTGPPAALSTSLPRSSPRAVRLPPIRGTSMDGRIKRHRFKFPCPTGLPPSLPRLHPPPPAGVLRAASCCEEDGRPKPRPMPLLRVDRLPSPDCQLQPQAIARRRQFPLLPHVREEEEQLQASIEPLHRPRPATDGPAHRSRFPLRPQPSKLSSIQFSVMSAQRHVMVHVGQNPFFLS